MRVTHCCATLTRTHIHLTRRTALFGSMYLLRKRTVEVYFVQSHDQTARTSPSTFPFLPSSQCQRADPGYLFRGRRQWKLGFRIHANKTLFRLPGSSSARFLNSLNSGSKLLGVVSEAGSIRGGLACQHPIFNFRHRPETENPRSKIALTSQWFASVTAAFPRRRLSDGRCIWATHFGVNTRKRRL